MDIGFLAAIRVNTFLHLALQGAPSWIFNILNDSTALGSIVYPELFLFPL